MNEQIQFDRPDIEYWSPLNDFLESYPKFKRNQIHWIYRNRKKNGYESAFKKIGRRIYIHAGIFSECIHSS